MKIKFNQAAEVQRLFPTPLYKTVLGRELLNKENKVAEKYLKNVEQNSGLNYNTKNNYVLKDKSFNELNKFIQFHLEKFFYKVFHADEKNKIYITQSWLNITTKDQAHHQHEHPNSFISGVFYFSANENDSIKFSNPIRYNQIQPTILKRTEDNSGSWIMPVTKGLLIMFPSRLEHSVLLKKNDNQRISLAFNTFLKGKLGENKSLNELIL